MFEYLIRRAKVVLEALPYLKRFNNKIIVLKYGGAAMENDELKDMVMQDVVLLKLVGMHPVIVHGGGPEINAALKRKGIKPLFVNGVRVTDKATMEVVQKVLGGKVNAEICRLIKKNGGKAKGLYGKKGRVIKAQKLTMRSTDGHLVDLGHVGKAVGIKFRFLQKLIKKDYIPVLAPIGVGRGGKIFNINADTAAAEIAGFLKASKLILMTDVRGVLDKEGQLISELNAHKTDTLIKQGVISGGMIPKVKCGLRAIKSGVEKVHIIDGRIPHAVLLEIFTDHGIGTMVVKNG